MWKILLSVDIATVVVFGIFTRDALIPAVVRATASVVLKTNITTTTIAFKTFSDVRVTLTPPM